jgi:CRP/FNR family transcriptional regulator
MHVEECSLEGTNILKITHETIGEPHGTRPWVVTRMLRYFQNEGMVKLLGTVTITDEEKLRGLSE